MATTHSTITDPNIHEPKGVAAADDNTVYRAGGAGSGTWEAPLKLIETITAVGGESSLEFNGLDWYRSLYLVIEGIEYSSSAALNHTLLQFGDPYRTSGYYNLILTDGLNLVNDDTSGIIIGRNLATRDTGWGFVEICNFNVAAPTSVRGMWNSGTENRYNSATLGSNTGYSFFGIYPTAEVHEDLKVLSSAGYTFNAGTVLTLYGIS